MSLAAPDLSIVIVSYNTYGLVVECIQSILDAQQRSQPRLAVEIIVVDNASTDGTPSQLRARFPQVHLIANPDNRFFSAANNQGLLAAKGTFVMLLNPDTLITGHTLSQLVTYLREHHDVGAVTTTMRSPDGTLQQIGSRCVTLEYLLFHYSFLGKLWRDHEQRLSDWLWYREWDRTSAQDLGVLGGAGIVAARTIWQRVDGLDARMPMYFSDDYFSLKVRELGLRTRFIPSDGIVHYENASTKKVSRRALNLYFSDLLTYTQLRFGRNAAWLLTALILPTWIVQHLKSS